MCLILLEVAMSEEKRVLNLPRVTRVKYQKNFIKTAVCELRFPTFLELEEKPPRSFQAKIRKDYPFYEPQVAEQIGGPNGISREMRYLFRSKDKHWTVTVKSFALAIETSKYIDFEDFFKRFSLVLESAKDMIDSDFFTRVGLRYINWIPIEDGNLEGWIKSELILPIIGDVLGSADSFTSLIEGKMERGQYAFRQSLQNIDDSNNKAQSYVLDTDYSCENVEYKDVKELVNCFNKTNFAFFSWCLGDKAKRLLGEGKTK